MILTTGIDIISEEGRDNYFNVALQYLHVNMVYIYMNSFMESSQLFKWNQDMGLYVRSLSLGVSLLCGTYSRVK